MGRAASFAVVGLFVLACVYTLYLGRELLMPMATAFVLFVILSPFVRRASRWKIPRGVSAALLVLGLFVIFALGVYALSDPISEWRQRAPELLSQVEFKLRGLKESVKEVQEASKEVEKIAEQVSGGNERTQKVVVESPSLIQRFLGGLQSFGVQLAIIFVLLFFMLASGDFFLETMIKALPIQSDRRCGLTVARQVEQQLSGYIVTVSIINAGLSVSLCIAFYLIGLPNALLWGAMAGLLNFVPFIGAAVGAFVVGVVSLVSFDSLAYAAAAPAGTVGPPHRNRHARTRK